MKRVRRGSSMVVSRTMFPTAGMASAVRLKVSISAFGKTQSYKTFLWCSNSKILLRLGERPPERPTLSRAHCFLGTVRTKQRPLGCWGLVVCVFVHKEVAILRFLGIVVIWVFAAAFAAIDRFVVRLVDRGIYRGNRFPSLGTLSRLPCCSLCSLTLLY